MYSVQHDSIKLRYFKILTFIIYEEIITKTVLDKMIDILN